MTSVISTPGPMQETFLGKNNVCHILTYLALRLIFLLRRINLYCPATLMLNFRRSPCSISGGFRCAAAIDDRTLILEGLKSGKRPVKVDCGAMPAFMKAPGKCYFPRALFLQEIILFAGSRQEISCLLIL